MTKTLGEVLQSATDAVRSMTYAERMRGEPRDPCADLPQCPHTRVVGYCKDCDIEELRARVVELEINEECASKANAERAYLIAERMKAEADSDDLRILLEFAHDNEKQTEDALMAVTKERDELRARVAELEDIEKEACKACMQAEDKRDELRAALDWALNWIIYAGDSSGFRPEDYQTDAQEYARARRLVGWDK